MEIIDLKEAIKNYKKEALDEKKSVEGYRFDVSNIVTMINEVKKHERLNGEINAYEKLLGLIDFYEEMEAKKAKGDEK